MGDNGTESIRKLIADTITDLNGNDSFRSRLDPQYEDAGNVFKGLVDCINPEEKGTRSMKNVAIAYKTARDFLGNEFGSDSQSIKSFYGYLVHRVKLIRIRADSVARALKIFETINDRGIGLDGMDLLKNLLFMQTDPIKFDRLKDQWKLLSDTLFRAGEKPLRFLRYYIFSTFGVSKVREDDLFSWFQKNEKLIGLTRDPVGFVNNLQDVLDSYLNILKGRGPRGEASAAVESMLIIAGRSTRQYLILLLAGRYLPKNIFEALCGDIESLMFIYLITNQNKREFEGLFTEWVPKLSNIKSIDDYDSFAQLTFRKRREELSARFHREFAALDGGSLRQYQLRYILGKLTQYVDLMAYGQSSQSHIWLARYCDGANVHIEHILPQSPDDEVHEEFGEGAEDRSLLWSIGNLALAEKSINTSLGRRTFSYKRTIYPQSQFLLTRVIGKKPDIGRTAIDRAVATMTPFEVWTRRSIIQRAGWLSNLAAEVWSVPIFIYDK